MPVRPPTSWDSPWCTPIVAFGRARPASIEPASASIRAARSAGSSTTRGSASTRRSAPASATASASGVREGDQTTSTQCASAFMPVSALTRAGVDRVSSGS